MPAGVALQQGPASLPGGSGRKAAEAGQGLSIARRGGRDKAAGQEVRHVVAHADHGVVVAAVRLAGGAGGARLTLGARLAGGAGRAGLSVVAKKN